MTDRATTTMAGIAGAVALGSALVPRHFLRLFGVAPEEVTGATRLGFGLFATRNAYVAMNALRDDPAAKAAFLPLQALDQVVFWHAYATRSIPRPGALLAISVSGAIVAIDLRRRKEAA
jgi:hypothetical protein